MYTFNDYLAHGRSVYTSDPHIRLGQAFMNVLATERPDLYEAITGTEVDPYYDSSLTATMLDVVSRCW